MRPVEISDILYSRCKMQGEWPFYTLTYSIKCGATKCNVSLHCKMAPNLCGAPYGLTHQYANHAKPRCIQSTDKAVLVALFYDRCWQ